MLFSSNFFQKATLNEAHRRRKCQKELNRQCSEKLALSYTFSMDSVFERDNK